MKVLKGGGMKVSVSKNKKEKVVVLSDWHVPFEDKKIIELELAFCKEEQPDIIIFHELHDFYPISSFEKNPERLDDLQREIDLVNVYLERFRKACPKSRFILLDSNHLDRLRKFIWKMAPAFNGVRALKIQNLLELSKFKVEFKKEFMYHSVLFKHGNIVRKFSSYTAKGEWEKEGTSGCSGHTHRLGIFFHTDRSGSHVWVETGCGCQLDAEYINGIANWQHGFAVFGFDKSGHFYPTVVPIVNYRIDWGNKTFTVDAKKST